MRIRVRILAHPGCFIPEMTANRSSNTHLGHITHLAALCLWERHCTAREK